MSTRKVTSKKDVAEKTAIILRTCDKDLKSHGGFQWPEKGHVEAPDWDPTPRCGGGLHGLLEGEGEWDLLDWTPTSKALLVRVAQSSMVAFDGKVKFSAGEVLEVLPLAFAICCLLCDGAKIEATVAALTKGKKKNSSQLAASGDSSQLAASGDCSQLAASGTFSKLAASGYYSKLAASGDCSQLAASGYSSQLAASGYASKLAASGYALKLAASGDSSKLAASGDSSKLAASGYASQLAASGDSSKLAASGDASKLAASGYASQLAASGDNSKLAASGDASKLAASGYASQLAASGDSSQLAASGHCSQLAASGDSSIVVSAAPGCVASAGEHGTIVLTRWVESEQRYRVSVGYVGEDGLKANIAYKLDDDGGFVEVGDPNG